MPRPKLNPPTDRRGAWLFQFGDEARAGGWTVGGWTAVGSGICYPASRIVEADGELWVEVPIPDTPPPLSDPHRRAQWEHAQRLLEQIDGRLQRGRGGAKAAQQKRETVAARNAALLDRARNALALDPTIKGPYALAGRLRCNGLSQKQIARIISKIFD